MTWTLRIAAADALGHVGPAAGDAVAALQEALDGRDLRLVIAAQKALKAIQSAAPEKQQPPAASK